MADKETTIEYSPEEIEEIERILGTVDRLNELMAQDIVPEPEPPKTEEDEFSDIDFNMGEPDDLDLPAGDLDGLGRTRCERAETLADFRFPSAGHPGREFVHQHHILRRCGSGVRPTEGILRGRLRFAKRG